MKRIISIIVLISILLTGTIVFAEGTGTETTKSKIVNKLQEFQAKIAEIKPLVGEIRANRTELLRLRADARTAYDKAKNKVQEMLKNKDNLTVEQIEAVKVSLKALQDNKKVLTGTIGEISEETISLRAAARDREFAGVKNALENIKKVQNLRIVELKEIIAELNKISAM